MLRVLPLSRTTTFWIVIGWTIAYTLLTDARPPAIRATILVTILCLARLMRRPPSPWNSLAAAGLVVLALNPADLFSTGVHLSFLAVATLMCVSPRWFLGARSDDRSTRPVDRAIPGAVGTPDTLVRGQDAASACGLHGRLAGDVAPGGQPFPRRRYRSRPAQRGALDPNHRGPGVGIPYGPERLAVAGGSTCLRDRL